MIREVFKTGNSIVVALRKEMLDALHLAEGGEVSVELDAAHRQIVIAPAADGVDVEFARQVADFIESYRPAIEALAR